MTTSTANTSLQRTRHASGMSAEQTSVSIPAWLPTLKSDDAIAQLRQLDLMLHVGELEADGYTIVPPEKVASPEFIDRMLEATLRVAEARTGVRPDLATGESHHNITPESRPQRAAGHRQGDTQQDNLYLLLFEDPVFQEALLNPVALALVTYLLGEHAKLIGDAAIIKGPSDVPTGTLPNSLHSDNYGIPAPFPPYAQVCNATWVLTDYTREGGALAFVPGSHKLARHPLTGEEGKEHAVPAEAAKGSLIFWHGNTWHAPFPRVAPGVRVTKIYAYGRQYITAQQPFREKCPPEALERNPRRFATMMGFDDPYPWGAEGSDLRTMLPALAVGQSLYA